jgi:cyanophycinase-like exopeptidase
MILASLLAAKAGALMLVGGGPTTREMVKKFAELCGGWNAPIVVLGQTHKDPADASKSRDFLIKEGFSNVQLFADSDLSAERKQALSTAILNSKGIWVPGGDQRLIVTRLGADALQECGVDGGGGETLWKVVSGGCGEARGSAHAPAPAMVRIN